MMKNDDKEDEDKEVDLAETGLLDEDEALLLENWIIEHPDKADEFNGWDSLEGFAWARILSLHPEFAEHCNWAKLKPMAWISLLRRRPQFADKCDKWDEMRPFGGDRLKERCEEIKRIISNED